MLANIFTDTVRLATQQQDDCHRPARLTDIGGKHTHRKTPIQRGDAFLHAHILVVGHAT